MTENQKRRMEDRLPGHPLQWDEESANDEIVALHRQLAAEKLRADQGWERAEAKSRECIELREVLAQAGVRGEPAEQELVSGIAYPTTYADLARLTPLQLWNRWYPQDRSISAREAFIAARQIPPAPTTPAQVPAAEVRRAALEEAAKLCEKIGDDFDYMAEIRRASTVYVAAIRSLAQSSTADKASEVRAAEWISVEDRLPELGQTVLGFNEDYGQRETKFDRWAPGSINRATYGDNAGHFRWSEPQNNWGSSWSPTHWKPLDNPPSTADSGNTGALGEGAEA